MYEVAPRASIMCSQLSCPCLWFQSRSFDRLVVHLSLLLPHKCTLIHNHVYTVHPRLSEPHLNGHRALKYVFVINYKFVKVINMYEWFISEVHYLNHHTSLLRFQSISFIRNSDAFGRPVATVRISEDALYIHDCVLVYTCGAIAKKGAQPIDQNSCSEITDTDKTTVNTL